jgi:hypothetical protein
MEASNRDSERSYRQQLLRAARELVARAQHAKRHSRRLISDAERLIPPVLCECGAPLYARPGVVTRACPSCSAAAAVQPQDY